MIGVIGTAGRTAGLPARGNLRAVRWRANGWAPGERANIPARQKPRAAKVTGRSNQAPVPPPSGPQLDSAHGIENTRPPMADPKTNELMERIVSLCKRRGFIFQSSEIYGGLNGFWDYGPLGAELKRNVKDLWWRSMTQQRDDVVGLDATIIMHPAIWKASGHVDTFSDPMVDCKVCGKRFRADQVDPQSGTAVQYTGASEAETVCKELVTILITDPNHKPRADKVAKEFYRRRGLKDPELLPTTATAVEHSIAYCGECGGELTEPRPFNLMFETTVGPVRSDENIAYLRPETAQAIFVQFKNVVDSSRVRSALRHRPDRQSVPQRGHPAQFHLPLPRVRTDGTRILHPPRRSDQHARRPGRHARRPRP